MIEYLLLGLGLVCVIEGLVVALAPSVYEDILEMLRGMSPETRAVMGLSVVALGVFLVWVSRFAG